MPEWKYGTAGDTYPVKPREIWHVGPHRLMCGDIEQGDHVRLLDGMRPDVIYSDPPWDAGNMKAFLTKAGMSREANFHRFIEDIAEILEQSSGASFIEMSVRTGAQVERILQQFGLDLHAQQQVLYGKPPRPNLQQVYSRDALRFTPAQVAGHTGGVDLVVRSLAPTGAQTVLDFCVGLGHTAEAAHRLGMTLYAMELHPRRLARTIERLVRLTGQPARRESR